MNLMNLKGNPGRVRELLEFVQGETGSPNALFDLNRILPMPLPVQMVAEANELYAVIKRCFPRQLVSFQELLAKAEYDCLVATGYANAEDWARGTWGSVRNVYRCRYNKTFPLELTFNSIASPPLTALAELSRIFPDLVLEVYYENADLTVTGWALFADGDGCDERLLKD
ncbi:MAG: Ferredoxin-like domain in Api92-like protein [Acidobacteriota bacterium]|jgi:hypothetical protein|nr:Ferredoxin-like domain in Api92-like protein [Acidobacteriota bacterium]